MHKNLRYLVLFLLFSLVGAICAQTVQLRDVYEAKKKDTIYGIARMYSITIEELMDANPEMKSADYKLKKGTKVNIPQKKVEAAKPVQSAKSAKTKPGQTLHVGVMLPLHNENGDGDRMVEYYRGFLMGCDSLRQEGINTEVYAWNVAEKADIRLTLMEANARKCDIIVGPLYSVQVPYLADFCKRNDIKLFIPFSTSATDVQTNDHVYQVYQNNDRVYGMSHKAFIERFKDCNVVIIDCNDTTSRKGPFTFGLRKMLEQSGVPYQITNLESSIEVFKKAFSTTKRNMVVLNTARSPQLNLTFRKLNVLTEVVPDLQICMYGYTEWLLYEKTYRQLFHKYETYIPSTYYYYKGLSRIATFEQNYKKWFNESVQERYIPRLSIIGYDHANYMLRGLFKYGSDFCGNPSQSNYKYLQTPLRFEHVSENGGYQNNSFMLVHYKKNGVIEKLEY